MKSSVLDFQYCFRVQSSHKCKKVCAGFKMEEIIAKSKRNVATKTQCPINMSLDAFVEKALENSESPNMETIMRNFFKTMSVIPSHPLSKRPSGFKIIKNGVIEKICLNKEPHGVFCQNEGHLGSYSNISMISEECDPCNESGAQMKTARGKWSLPPLKPILATCPVLFLVLLSRSSSGATIKQEIYDDLHRTVNENKR